MTHTCAPWGHHGAHVTSVTASGRLGVRQAVQAADGASGVKSREAM